MTNRLRLCIDMDGVLANFVERAIENAKKVYGIEIEHDEIKETKIADLLRRKFIEKRMKETPHMRVRVKDKKSFEKEVFENICPPGFFESLNPYPNAIAAVERLWLLGHDITFLTQPLEWKYSSSEKIAWLAKHFGHLKYSVIMVNDMESKYRVQCDCLIDDDPRALHKLPPYHGICIARPWNEEYREKTYEGIVVKSMEEAANWLLKNKDFMSLPDRGGIDAPKSC